MTRTRSSVAPAHSAVLRLRLVAQLGMVWMVAMVATGGSGLCPSRAWAAPPTADGGLPDGRSDPRDAGLRAAPGLGSGLAPADGGAWFEGKVLRVGYSGSLPFVVETPEAPSGLSLSVWQAVADELDARSRLRKYPSVPALLDAVATGEIDVAVGPLSVTAQRTAVVDFLQPYFSARVGILSRADTSAWERLRPFANRAFLIGVVTLLVILLVVGTLVWVVERRHNPDHFPVEAHRGIAEGMWFALVTMTTVGYGDRAPVTVPGRVITGVWMVFAMVAASSITAGIATALTLSQIDTGGITRLEDLAHQRVAVVHGTPGQQIARRYGARRLSVASKEDGIAKVRGGQADAMLYDLPILDHYVQQSEGSDLIAHGTPVHADDYAFAVARGSRLYRPLNRVVLELRETRAIAEIASDWLVEE